MHVLMAVFFKQPPHLPSFFYSLKSHFKFIFHVNCKSFHHIRIRRNRRSYFRISSALFIIVLCMSLSQPDLETWIHRFTLSKTSVFTKLLYSLFVFIYSYHGLNFFVQERLFQTLHCELAEKTRIHDRVLRPS